MRSSLRGNSLSRKKLGEGAFGVVYLAEQQIFDIPFRTVALKVMKTPVRGSIDAKNLFSDALVLIKILNKCGDPVLKSRFVDILDVGLGSTGKSTDLGYIAMEIVDKDLSAISKVNDKKRVCTVTEALTYLTPVVEALAFMHTQKTPLLHRDLKPDNVLVKSQPSLTVKVADFGLATEDIRELDPVPAAGTWPYQDLESFTIGLSND